MKDLYTSYIILIIKYEDITLEEYYDIFQSEIYRRNASNDNMSSSQ